MENNLNNYKRLGFGFNITCTDAVDRRLYLTKNEMLTAEDVYELPEKYFCICPDDGSLYLYNVNNTIDSITGKYRLIDTEINYEKLQNLPKIKVGNTELDITSVIELVAGNNVSLDIDKDNKKITINATGGGEPGPVGPTGPGFYKSSATIDDNVGIPIVTTSITGTGEDRELKFDFKNIKGENGPVGPTGQTGPTGADGKSVSIKGSVAKWADLSGIEAKVDGDGWIVEDASKDPEIGEKEYIGVLYVYSSNGNKWTYAGQIKGPTGAQGPKGDQGVQGPAGPTGQATYTWIKYSKYSTGKDPEGKPAMTDTPQVDTEYLGLAHNKTEQAESTNPDDYTWSNFKGDQGIPGEPGEDGTSLYTWVKYANSSTPAPSEMFDDPIDPNGKPYKYIGLGYNKPEQKESTDYKDYKWSNYIGADGKDGISAYSLTIDNDFDSVPCDKDGNPKKGYDWKNQTKHTVKAFFGTEQLDFEITSDIPTNDNGYKLHYSVTNVTYEAGSVVSKEYSAYILALSADVGYVTYTLYNGTLAVASGKFEASKLYAGADGSDGADAVDYWITATATEIQKDKEDKVTPNKITFNFYKQVGSEESKTYTGYYTYKIDNGTESTPASGSSYEIESATISKQVTVTLYSDASKTAKYDSETVSVVAAGKDGIPITLKRAYYQQNALEPLPTKPTSLELPEGWTWEPKGVTESMQYEFMSECEVINDELHGEWSKVVCHEHYGASPTKVNTFNALFGVTSTGGLAQGLGAADNGDVYINATFITSGAINVGNTTVGTLFNADVDAKNPAVTIGGFQVNKTSLHNNDGPTTIDDYSHAGVYVGTDGIHTTDGTDVTGKFANLMNGILTANGANLTGKITSAEGDIAGFKFGVDQTYEGKDYSGANRFYKPNTGDNIFDGVGLYNGTGWLVDDNGQGKEPEEGKTYHSVMFYAGANVDPRNGKFKVTKDGWIFIGGVTGVSEAKFKVDPDGNFVATNATISGNLNTDSLEISDGTNTSLLTSSNFTVSNAKIDNLNAINNIIFSGKSSIRERANYTAYFYKVTSCTKVGTTDNFTVIAKCFDSSGNEVASPEDFTTSELAVNFTLMGSLYPKNIGEITFAKNSSSATKTFTVENSSIYIIDEKIQLSNIVKNLVLNGTATLAISANGNIETTGSLLPAVSGTYDLGSSTYKWKDLYLSGAIQTDLTINSEKKLIGKLDCPTINSSGSVQTAGKISIVKISQNDYSKLTTKDPEIMYLVF